VARDRAGEGAGERGRDSNDTGRQAEKEQSEVMRDRGGWGLCRRGDEYRLMCVFPEPGMDEDDGEGM
jgi:hypothetical protein